MEYSIITAISEEPFFADIGHFIINSGITSESIISKLYSFNDERIEKIFSALQLAKVLSEQNNSSERQILMNTSEFDSLLESCKKDADPLDSLQLDLLETDAIMHKENHWKSTYGTDDETILAVIFDTILHDGEIRVKRDENSELRSREALDFPDNAWRKESPIRYICYDVSLPSAGTDFTWLLIPQDSIISFTDEKKETLQVLLTSWNIPVNKVSLIFSDQNSFVDFVKKLGDYHPDLPFSVILVDTEKKKITQRISIEQIHEPLHRGLFAKIMDFLKLKE